MTVDTNAPERIWLQHAVSPQWDDTWCEDKQEDTDTPYIRLDLHEAAVRKAREVKVKKLVWTDTRLGVYAFDFEAKTSIGTYNAWSFRIKTKHGSERWVHGWNGHRGIERTDLVSFESAKAAAQADFERRIREALE